MMHLSSLFCVCNSQAGQTSWVTMVNSLNHSILPFSVSKITKVTVRRWWYLFKIVINIVFTEAKIHTLQGILCCVIHRHPHWVAVQKLHCISQLVQQHSLCTKYFSVPGWRFCTAFGAQASRIRNSSAIFASQLCNVNISFQGKNNLFVVYFIFL